MQVHPDSSLGRQAPPSSPRLQTIPPRLGATQSRPQTIPPRIREGLPRLQTIPPWVRKVCLGSKPNLLICSQVLPTPTLSFKSPFQSSTCTAVGSLIARSRPVHPTVPQSPSNRVRALMTLGTGIAQRSESINCPSPRQRTTCRVPDPLPKGLAVILSLPQAFKVHGLIDMGQNLSGVTLPCPAVPYCAKLCCVSSVPTLPPPSLHPSRTASSLRQRSPCKPIQLTDNPPTEFFPT
jgi:hypothetical protein